MGIVTMKIQRNIAFLRAINVGGHTVKMDHLRKLFEALGFLNVETFIASGNIIFESPSEDTDLLEKKIEGHLQKSLGYEVSTFIRSPSELAEIAKYRPFPSSELDVEGSSLYIAFVQAPPSDESQQKLMAFKTPVDDFHIHARVINWLSRKKISESSFSGALLERTMRNSTTVKKIAANYAEAQ